MYLIEYGLKCEYLDNIKDQKVTLPISANWKGNTFDSILVIVDRLTKIIHYELVKVIINALGLAKLILGMVVWHHGLPNLVCL